MSSENTIYNHIAWLIPFTLQNRENYRIWRTRVPFSRNFFSQYLQSNGWMFKKTFIIFPHSEMLMFSYPFIGVNPFMNSQTFLRTYSMTASATHKIFGRFIACYSTMVQPDVGVQTGSEHKCSTA